MNKFQMKCRINDEERTQRHEIELAYHELINHDLSVSCDMCYRDWIRRSFLIDAQNNYPVRADNVAWDYQFYLYYDQVGSYSNE